MESTRIVKARGGKLLRLTLTWSGDPAGLVERIKIHGDFFAHPEEAFDCLERYLAGKPLAEIRDWYKSGLEEFGVTVYGLLPEDIADAVAYITSGEQA